MLSYDESRDESEVHDTNDLTVDEYATFKFATTKFVDEVTLLTSTPNVVRMEPEHRVYKQWMAKWTSHSDEVLNDNLLLKVRMSLHIVIRSP